MDKKILKIFIVILILLLIASLVLTSWSLLNPLYFWALVIASAIFAYRILPELNK